MAVNSINQPKEKVPPIYFSDNKLKIADQNIVEQLANDFNLFKTLSGSYYGTGTYNFDGETSILCEFVPKAVFICNLKTLEWFGEYGIWIHGSNTMIVSGRQNRTNPMFTGNVTRLYPSADNTRYVLSWYNTLSSDNQLNLIDYIYCYLILG